MRFPERTMRSLTSLPQSRVDGAAVGRTTASLDAVRQTLDRRRREAAAHGYGVTAFAPPQLLPHALPVHHGPWQQVVLVPHPAPPLPPARASVQPWQAAARMANPSVQPVVGGVPPQVGVTLHGTPGGTGTGAAPPAHPGPGSSTAPPGAQSTRAAAEARDFADDMHPSLRRVVDMGFDPGRAHTALCSTHGDVERALALLLAAPS